jgi:hypothetical protein
MKPRSLVQAIVLIPIFITGCTFGEKRTEIRGNGQGGVDVKYVPNERASEPVSQAAPQTAPADDQGRIRQQQQQIDSLQSQLHEKDQEIQRLKGQPTTQP